MDRFPVHPAIHSSIVHLIRRGGSLYKSCTSGSGGGGDFSLLSRLIYTSVSGGCDIVRDHTVHCYCYHLCDSYHINAAAFINLNLFLLCCYPLLLLSCVCL